MTHAHAHGRTAQRTSTFPRQDPSYPVAVPQCPFLYLVVALWVKAVVMFSVLVCTVYVSTVLAARKPVSTRGQEKGTGNETVS